VIAKFQAHQVSENTYGHVDVRMRPVYHENDPNHPNYRFWEATPSGELSMYITNSNLKGHFKEGQVYTVTIEAEPAEA
jgi:hypothetical protein